MKRRRRPGLFHEYWYDLNGQEIRKATKAELSEAYRLWVVHADIREGRASPAVTQVTSNGARA
jgi:hypothetical protein